MPRAALTLSLWALVQAAPGAGGFAQAPPAVPSVVSEVLIQGGSESDRSFARRALGVQPGQGLSADALEAALAAVRATDRFRVVKGTLLPGAGGAQLKLELEAWPLLQAVSFRGDRPPSYRDQLFPEVRKRTTPGDFRIRRWVDFAQQKLRESGYPQAQVRISREAGDTRLVAEVKTGPAALVHTCWVVGSLGPYAEAQLLKVAGIRPGRTIWTQDLLREIQKRLRRRFVKDDRLKGHSEPKWDEATGLLTLDIQAGPKVRQSFEGTWHLSWKNREDLVPIIRAGSYSPELLNEGDQHLLHYLRGLGYLDAVVTHREEVLSADEIRIVFIITPGRQVSIQRLRFEGNSVISSRDLQRAAALPKGLLGGSPAATPELISALEDRIKAKYWSLGYANVVVRKQILKEESGKTTVLFQIHEKTRRTLEHLMLELPEGEDWHPWNLAECLVLVFCDHPAAIPPGTASSRTYKGDRPASLGVTATLEESRDPARPGMHLFTLTPSRPLPFVRNDLGVVFSELRQRTAALGARRPIPRPKFEEDEQGTTLRFEVPAQNLDKIRRVVVQGSDRTQAKAVFRELQLEPEQFMAPDRLSKAQTNLSNLGGGVFQRLDMMSLTTDGVEEAQGRVWQEGDLLVRGTERSPWVITSSFGYEKSQGYHFGLGVERLNVGGMGRTVDMGIRAGDATINNRTLRKMFPTGQYDRSVDMFSLGYTDPWFAPDWLPDRTRLHEEAAYLEEHQDVYLMRRRRVISGLEWHLSPQILFQFGHRFERSDVQSDFLTPHDLALVARSPARSTISAPYLQVSRDTRDSFLDPKEGSLSSLRLEFAAQLFGTDPKSSFLKVDLKQQWHWSLGTGASQGVVSLGLRAGAAWPTAGSSQELPLSERFFAGGPTTHRGVEPDALSPFGWIVLRDPNNLSRYQMVDGHPLWRTIPLGGQSLALVNLEYRFPITQSVWWEFFVDSGQVYQYLQPYKTTPQSDPTVYFLPDGTAVDPAKPPSPPPDPKSERPPYSSDTTRFPPFRTAIGMGVIFKIGVPIKLEYAEDVNRILGRTRTPYQRDSQLKGLLVSAGFQF